MPSGLFGIGTSALTAFQRALDTTAHNIANAGTEGYTRQRVNLAARSPQYAGFGYLGTGVETTSVERNWDRFVENQVRSYTASSTELNTFHQYAVQVDNVLADPDAGMSRALERFFDAMQDLADDPASTVARQVVITESRALADRFQGLAGWMQELNGQVNGAIEGTVDEINRLTESIADLNRRIVLADGVYHEVPPNDLLDQRDALVRELAEKVSIQTIQQDDGAVNIMVGSGQALVVGQTTTRLVAYRGDGVDAPVMVGLDGGAAGGHVPITEQLSGGELGGLMGFRERVLLPAMDELGRIAVSVGQLVNQQHRRGMDLNGNLGGDLFHVGAPQWSALGGTGGTLQLDWGDPGSLTGAEYRLEYDGSGWSLTRLDTGAAVALSGTGTAADPFVADGLSIVVNGTPAAGDAYLLQPTRTAALDLTSGILDPALLAAAAPVLGQADAANTGTARITPGEVSDIDNAAFQSAPGQLTPPLLVMFDSATSYTLYDNTDPTAPVALETVTGYDPVAGADLFPTPGGLDYGYRMRLEGAASAGDRFTIDYNDGGVGDNRNALAMADLLDEDLLAGGTESIGQAYRRMVGEVGTTTRQSEFAAEAQDRMLERAVAQREAVSGVNLDEEAANLVRYQQAYQAAAQIIAVADEMFQTLLNAVGR